MNECEYHRHEFLIDVKITNNHIFVIKLIKSVK